MGCNSASPAPVRLEENSILAGQRNRLRKITIVDYLPNEFSKEEYSNKLNHYTQAFQPFNFSQEIELWNVMFPIQDKQINQRLDEGRR